MKYFLLLAVVLVGSVALYGCKSQKNTSSEASPEVIDLGDGLTAEILTPGTGEVAPSGSNVRVHYVGTFEDGTQFDSSRDRGEPFPFTVGGGQVIKGWDQGVAGMKLGELRKLTIPPHLGYGSRDRGPIPANSTLIFEVELMEIVK